MSFAKEVKEELTKIKEEKCCMLAEISAFLHLNASITISSSGPSVEFSSTNLAVTRRFVELLKTLYDVEIEMISKQRERLNKENLYIIKVIKGANSIIYEHNMLVEDMNARLDFINHDCCKRAYLRGAFLCSGSVNDPMKSYHLEIAFPNEKEVVFLQRLMNEFDLNAKITKRRTTLIVYIKEVQKITDFLNIIGATRLYFAFEEARIERDYKNSLNRLINCELANEAKLVQASNTQINEIDLVVNHFGMEHLDPKINEVVVLRREFPDVSLKVLVEKALEVYNIKITKSGLNHRFRKIHDLAEQIKKGEITN